MDQTRRQDERGDVFLYALRPRRNAYVQTLDGSISMFVCVFYVFINLGLSYNYLHIIFNFFKLFILYYIHGYKA